MFVAVNVEPLVYTIVVFRRKPIIIPPDIHMLPYVQMDCNRTACEGVWGKVHSLFDATNGSIMGNSSWAWPSAFSGKLFYAPHIYIHLYTYTHTHTHTKRCRRPITRLFDQKCDVCSRFLIVKTFMITRSITYSFQTRTNQRRLRFEELFILLILCEFGFLLFAGVHY